MGWAASVAKAQGLETKGGGGGMGWAAPVANLAGAIGGALIGRSGQGKAIGAQERATMAQIQLERDRDAARQRRYESAMGDYRKEKDQYDTIRRALLGHYGINLPAPGGPAPAGGQAPAASGVSLGQLMGGSARISDPGPAAPAPVNPAPAPAMENPMEGDPFDWRRYGVS